MGGGNSTSEQDIVRAQQIRKRNERLEKQRLKELGRQIQQKYQNGELKFEQAHSGTDSNGNVQSSDLPDSSSLSKFTKAAQEFLNKQEVKRLAREKNLNIHGKLIKSKVGIDMNSIKFVQDDKNRSLYWLSLKYSASEKARISVYYCATQITNTEGLPTYFTIPPSLPSATITNVEKGNSKSFKGNEDCCFDVEAYEGVPLFNHTHNYYPCILTIEPRSKPSIDQDGVSDYQNQITYCVLRIDKTTNILQIAPIQQVLIAFEMAFLLQQIYGISDTLEEKKGDDTDIRLLAGEVDDNLEDGQLCVICLSEEKNTVVMPCGHLCVCKDCATTISKQKSPDCPVCRKKVKSFVPLNIKSIKKMEQQASTKGSKTKRIHDDSNKDYDLGFEI